MRRILALLLAAACAQARAGAIPEIVIVQTIVPDVGEFNPNVAAANFFAEELDDEGRVFPIVWSMTDPIFRASVDEGILAKPSISPSLAEAVEGAKRLKAEYLLVFEAYREADFILCKAKLYRGSREVWKDDRRMASSIDGSFAFENTMRTLARTWTKVIAQGPLKDLPPRKREQTPEPDPGSAPPVVAEAKDPPVPPNNQQVLVEAMKLLSARRIAEALNLLREAVDEEPLDVERRRALISAYLQVHENALAALEARRAASLFPEQIEFWTLSARAWLAAGNKDEALKGLNEAVARDPESPLTRMLLGELQLAALRFSFALEHFDKAVQRSPSAESHFRRAVARFLNGNLEGGLLDLSEARRLETTPDVAAETSRYRFAVEILRELAGADGADIPTMIQRAKVQHTDAELRSSFQALAIRIGGASALAQSLVAPEVHRNSHERLVLALNLLSQCLSDARAHLVAPSEDLLAEATLNLGEAMRHLRAAGDAFARELGKS